MLLSALSMTRETAITGRFARIALRSRHPGFSFEAYAL